MEVEVTELTRGEVYLIELDPTRGSEIRKTIMRAGRSMMGDFESLEL